MSAWVGRFEGFLHLINRRRKSDGNGAARSKRALCFSAFPWNMKQDLCLVLVVCSLGLYLFGIIWIFSMLGILYINDRTLCKWELIFIRIVFGNFCLHKNVILWKIYVSEFLITNLMRVRLYLLCKTIYTDNPKKAIVRINIFPFILTLPKKKKLW